MSKKTDDTRYEIITQEDPETGDLLIPLPPPLLKALNWKEGDDVQFDIDAKGQIIIRKVSN